MTSRDETVETCLSRLKFPYTVLSGDEIGITCPWCGYPENKRQDKTCSINAITGWGKCQHAGRCSKGGFNLYELRKKLNDPDLEHERRATPPPKTYKRVESHPEPKQPVYQEAVRYMESRGLKPESWDMQSKFGCVTGHLHGKSPMIAFPIRDLDGTIVDYKYRLRDGKEKPWKNFQRATDCPGLFGLHLADMGMRQLILVEGELDAILLHQLGAMNVVSVPNATDMGWIDRLWDTLHEVSEFYLAYDMDTAGEQGAAECAKRLGIERCRRIKMPYKDPLEWFDKGMTLRDFVHAQLNSVEYRPGKLLKLSEIMDEIFAPPSELERGDMCQWPTVNRILRGFRGGEMTLWAGDDGTGKSTLLFNLLLHLALSSIPVCTGSFELRPIRQGRWLRDMVGGDRNTLELVGQYYWLINHVGNIDPDELLKAYIYCAKRYEVRHFLTDSMLMLGLADDDYAAQAKFAKDVKQHLVDPFSVHHHLICHSRKGHNDAMTGRDKNSIKGSGSVKNAHDNTIMVYRDVEDGGTINTFMDIKKSREHGNGAKKIALIFDQETRTFSEVA